MRYACRVEEPLLTGQEAAVLIAAFRRQDGALRIVLVRRGRGGIHGHQLALPGGKREPADASLLDTALREAQEEVGLPPSRIRLLCSLPVVTTRTTGFAIHPFLAQISPPAVWSWQEEEIDAVLEPEVGLLLQAQGKETLHFPTWPAPRPTAVYRLGDELVWGVTFRILHPLLPRLLEGEWEI